VLDIYAVESSRRLLARSAVGDRAPLHCTGVGKAILAFLDQAEIMGIIGRVGLPAATPNTLTSIDALLGELRRTATRGYAFDDQENEVGNRCIGAPLFDATGRGIGACSGAGTDPKILGKRTAALAEQLQAAALAISGSLGYVPALVSRITSARPEGIALAIEETRR